MSKRNIKDVLRLVGAEELTVTGEIRVYLPKKKELVDIHIRELARLIDTILNPELPNPFLHEYDNYYMATVDPTGGPIELLASGGGYWLYSADAPQDVTDVELTNEEAESALGCRVFHDFTGLTLYERKDIVQGVMVHDRRVLDHVESDARSYFHTLDLSLTEINEKLALFEAPLRAAAAGAVESTLGALQLLLVPQVTTTVAYVFDPDNTTNNRVKDYLTQSDALYSEHGIDLIEFNASSNRLNLEFVDSSSRATFQDGYSNIKIDGVSHALTVVQGDSRDLTMTFTEAALDAVVSTTNGGGTVTIEFTSNGVGPGVNAGETEVITHMVEELQLHLKKFPR